ncbi:MAG: DsbE family thiol:disulfide interchange protein [Pseudomonadota bacterium]
MPRLLKGLIPLALFAGLAVFLAIGLTRDPSILPSEMIDRPLPEFEMQTLSGETVATSDLVGEVALLNVFGSWCVACLSEHPLFMELAGDPDVTMIGVNWRDTRPKAESWLDRHGDPYDLILFDPDSSLAIDLGVTGAPETFVIDARGNIRYKHTGIVTQDIWENRLQPLMADLRAESPSRAASPSL